MFTKNHIEEVLKTIEHSLFISKTGEINFGNVGEYNARVGLREIIDILEFMENYEYANIVHRFEERNHSVLKNSDNSIINKKNIK